MFQSSKFIYYFQFQTHYSFLAGKIIALEEEEGLTSATGTQPEKKKLHKQKIKAMMTIFKKNVSNIYIHITEYN